MRSKMKNAVQIEIGKYLRTNKVNPFKAIEVLGKINPRAMYLPKRNFQINGSRLIN